MVTKKKRTFKSHRQKFKINSLQPHKTGHVQREFHGMPAWRHETLAVSGNFFIHLI
jgi:hypothetical protein